MVLEGVISGRASGVGKTSYSWGKERGGGEVGGEEGGEGGGGVGLDGMVIGERR